MRELLPGFPRIPKPWDPSPSAEGEGLALSAAGSAFPHLPFANEDRYGGNGHMAGHSLHNSCRMAGLSLDSVPMCDPWVS